MLVLLPALAPALGGTVSAETQSTADIAVAGRTHSASEQAYFESLLHRPGLIGRAVYAEREVALSLAYFTLLAVGRSDDEADVLIDSLRERATLPTETFAAMHTRELEAVLSRASRDGRKL